MPLKPRTVCCSTKQMTLAIINVRQSEIPLRAAAGRQSGSRMYERSSAFYFKAASSVGSIPPVARMPLCQNGTEYLRRQITPAMAESHQAPRPVCNLPRPVPGQICCFSRHLRRPVAQCHIRCNKMAPKRCGFGDTTFLCEPARNRSNQYRHQNDPGVRSKLHPALQRCGRVRVNPVLECINCGNPWEQTDDPFKMLLARLHTIFAE